MREFRQHTEDLVAAVGAASSGIVVTDPSRSGNPVVWVNGGFSAITGYPASEVVGRSLKILQGPNTDPQAIVELRDAIRHHRSAVVDLINYRRDGCEFLMRVAIDPVVDAAGRLSAYVGVLSDVTQLRAERQAAAESEERLRAVIEAVPLPMLTVSEDLVVVRANESAHRILAVPPGGLIGRRTLDFHYPGDNSAQRFCHALAEGTEPQRQELRICRADGTPLWVLASARRFTVVGRTRALVIFQDVTELKRREEELTSANEEAERSIRARMRFLAAASHDLRQPLQALALFASALDHHVSTAQARTIVQSMKVSLRGMEEMFDSLMDMSKLDAGVMKAEPQTFMINDVFEQVEANYRPQAEAAGLELRMVATSLAVRSDPRLLARIIGNFLSNAIRYTRHGRILVGARRKGNIALLQVLDSGPGIPDDQRLEMFREYRRGDQPNLSGRGAGTGLGLAIVQRLARLLGHRLEVRSQLGRGSCFAVAVPLAEDWCPLAEVEAGPNEEVRQVEGATVVVLDDDPDIREGLRILLSDWGCRTVVAEEPNAALGALAEQGLRADAVLADLHLRAKDAGVSAIREIRAAQGRDLPAFLFTGDTEAAGGDRLAWDFPILRKPLDPIRLRTLLADALGR